MPNEIECLFSNEGTRNEVRSRVVLKLMEEEAGQGTADLASKYNYTVETLKDGRNIILTRHANLKNGFDFLIRVTDTNFNIGNGRFRDYPTHDNIINDLKLKKSQNEDLYEQFYSYIKLTFLCNEIIDEWFDELNFEVGYPPDLLLKTIKWFFIEQDIRYWNYSGRNMLMEAIPE